MNMGSDRVHYGSGTETDGAGRRTQEVFGNGLSTARGYGRPSGGGGGRDGTKQGADESSRGVQRPLPTTHGKRTRQRPHQTPLIIPPPSPTDAVTVAPCPGESGAVA